MAEAWPGTVPQTVLAGTLKESPENNRLDFKPEVGPEIRRRRISINTSVLSWNTLLTKTEFTNLLAFYKDTLQDGALSFTRTHPRLGTTQTFQFLSPPAGDDVPPSRFMVQIQVRQMP